MRGRAVDEVLAQTGLFQGLAEEAVEPVLSRLETQTLDRLAQRKARDGLPSFDATVAGLLDD